VTYTLGVAPELTLNDTLWKLDLSGATPLPSGGYEVAVMADGLSDATTSEILIGVEAMPGVTISTYDSNSLTPTVMGTIQRSGSETLVVALNDTLYRKGDGYLTVDGEYFLHSSFQSAQK
jgi:hypothetical protein